MLMEGWLPWTTSAVSCALLLAALARPVPLQVRAEDPAAHTLRSFSSSLDRGARWSAPESVIVLHGVRAGDFVMRLRLSAASSPDLQFVSVYSASGTPDVTATPAMFAVGPAWSEYTFAVRVRGWSALFRPPQLGLRTSPYLLDPRGTERGVALSDYTLVPAGTPLLRLAAAVPIAGAWTWAAALLGMAVARTLRHAPRPGTAALVAAVVSGVGGLLLAAYAFHDPYAFAWTLAPPVISMAAITVVLAVVGSGRFTTSVVARGRTRVEAVAAWLVAGLALAIVYVQHGLFFPAVLAFAAAVAWLFLRAGGGEEEFEPCLLPRAWTMRALGAVLAVAFVMRFAEIRDLPYGLWRDDARYGLVALHMMEDPAYRPAYVPELITLPGLGIRALSLGLRLFGITNWSMRTITAGAGALTVIPLFGLVRRLSGRSDVALLAAALLAVSSWHVTVSRISSPAALDPLFELTGLWLLASALGVGAPPPLSRTRRLLMLLAAGSCIGVSVQTYHSGRAAPLLALAMVATWSRPPRERRASNWELLVVAVGFVIVAAPFLRYAWERPQELNARTAAVFLPRVAVAEAQAPLAAIDASVGRHLAMFHLEGDRNGRRNVPRRSMLDPITGLGLLAGLFAMVRRRGRVRGGWFFLVALVIGLVPSVLAVEGPHSLRSIDAVAFACALAGWGLLELVGGVAGLAGARAGGAFAILVLAALAVNAWTYFEVGAHDERVWRSSEPLATQVGMFVRTLADREGAGSASHVYLSPDIAANSVTRFLAYGLPVRTYKEGFSAPSPADVFVVASAEDREVLERQAIKHGAAPPLFAGTGRLLPDGRQPAFTLYRLPMASTLSQPRSP